MKKAVFLLCLSLSLFGFISTEDSSEMSPPEFLTSLFQLSDTEIEPTPDSPQNSLSSHQNKENHIPKWKKSHPQIIQSPGEGVSDYPLTADLQVPDQDDNSMDESELDQNGQIVAEGFGQILPLLIGLCIESSLVESELLNPNNEVVDHQNYTELIESILNLRQILDNGANEEIVLIDMADFACLSPAMRFEYLRTLIPIALSNHHKIEELIVNDPSLLTKNQQMVTKIFEAIQKSSIPQMTLPDRKTEDSPWSHYEIEEKDKILKEYWIQLFNAETTHFHHPKEWRDWMLHSFVKIGQDHSDDSVKRLLQSSVFCEFCLNKIYQDHVLTIAI